VTSKQFLGFPLFTLEFCRDLADGSAVMQIQTRNEIGAGFMADGYDCAILKALLENEVERRIFYKK